MPAEDAPVGPADERALAHLGVDTGVYRELAALERPDGVAEPHEPVTGRPRHPELRRADEPPSDRQRVAQVAGRAGDDGHVGRGLLSPRLSLLAHPHRGNCRRGPSA